MSWPSCAVSGADMVEIYETARMEGLCPFKHDCYIPCQNSFVTPLSLSKPYVPSRKFFAPTTDLLQLWLAWHQRKLICISDNFRSIWNAKNWAWNLSTVAQQLCSKVSLSLFIVMKNRTYLPHHRWDTFVRDVCSLIMECCQTGLRSRFISRSSWRAKLWVSGLRGESKLCCLRNGVLINYWWISYFVS